MIVKIILLVVILLIVFILFLPEKAVYQGPPSDHFDGKLFYNPTIKDNKSAFSVFKWWFSRERAAWPEKVANLPASPIEAVHSPNQVKVTFVNHATMLIQSLHVTILTDPIWSMRASPFSFYGPKRVRDPGIAFDDLPHIDLVLISHNHYDHLDKQTLQQLNHKFHPIYIVPLGNRVLLHGFGIDNNRIIELDWWQKYEYKNALVTLLPTQHWSARWLNDKYKTLWGAYGIELENKKIYFAGDAGYSSYFSEVKNKWGRPDIAFIPIGSYLPRWFMKLHHMDPKEAVRAHLDLGSQKSIAMHYGTFQLSDEAYDQPIKNLQKALQKESLSENDFIILPEGQSLLVSH